MDAVTNIADWLIDKRDGENAMREMTNDGRADVKHYIRCEHLIDDLIRVYRMYFTISGKQEARAHSARTKERLRYDHDVSKWYSADEIAALYRVSPTWSEHEEKAYGGLLSCM